MQESRLYLDYNATSPLSPSVSDWLRSGEVIFANPASQHAAGKSARKSVNQSRQLIFSTFKQSESDTKLFFHSGASEGLMTVAYSFSEWARLEKRPLLICYSLLDHPAVTSLGERYLGDHVSSMLLERDSDLHYRHAENLRQLQDLKAARPDLIILYHHLWVHNETGQVSPLAELSALKSVGDLYLHVDAVQAPGKIADWQNLSHGDYWTFSGHKLGALKGIGFTLFKKQLKLYPLITGGGQQQGLRSGTENSPGIYSLSLALQDLLQVKVELNGQMREKLLTFMQAALKGIGEVVSSGPQCSNTIYFFFYHLTSDIALALFDLNGLMLSAGSACSSGAAKESQVLLQLGKSHYARNGLRLSFDFQLSEADLIELQHRLELVFKKVKKQATDCP